MPYRIKHKVSSGDIDNSYKSFQKHQKFEANFQTQGKNFSEDWNL